MNSEKQYNILVLGAFDRYNYGDLLFPYMIENALSNRIPNASFYFYGLKKSDLSRYGGKKTMGIRTFYKDCKRLPNTIVIIAGGEAIGISWLRMFSFYSFLSKFIAKFQRFFNVELWIKKYLGAKTELPFLFSKNDVGCSLVVLNSLGESGASPDYVKLSNKFSCLQLIDYFAVRDILTFNAFSVFDRIQLYPDSAILMSNVFSIEFLVKQASIPVINFIEKKKKSYLFLQISKDNLGNNASKLASLCDKLYEKRGIITCLCPIGMAYGHEDQSALREIANKIMSDFFFFEKVNIWDIMLLIAESKTYMGTSLHGVITSMSFQVPYIGIGEPSGKVSAYIKTWGRNSDICLSLESEVFIDRVIEEITKENHFGYELNKINQIEKINFSFDNMRSLILGS